MTVEPVMFSELASTQDHIVNSQPGLSFVSNSERQVARSAFSVFRAFEHLGSSQDLLRPDVQAAIIREVAAERDSGPQTLDIIDEPVDLPAVIQNAAQLYINRSIDIPRIVIVPVGDFTFGYTAFTLDTSRIHLQPVAQDILIQDLVTEARFRLVPEQQFVDEPRLENYIVYRLMDFNDISYDREAELLYDLAGQVISHLRTYLRDEAAVENVVKYHRRLLADVIHAQMQNNRWERAVDYEAKVSRGFQTLRPNHYTSNGNEPPRNFRHPLNEGQYIRGIRFGGFRRCLYPEQKFDSDAERRFAVIFETDNSVLKWFKPAQGQFQIDYNHGQGYEPDFVVETKLEKLLVEPKRADEITDPEVQQKASAAATWCKHATQHELSVGGKPWSYLLVPHDEIYENLTLTALKAAYQAIA